MVLCDLSKAFDSINRNILFLKLASCKIDNFWFEDYLTKRTQAVQIGKTVSSVREVAYGVPQGSILGPLLFAIFVNDMSKIVKNCEVVQYADDSQFMFTGSPNDIKTMKEKAELTMSKVKHYFDSNGLKVNPQKTQVIFTLGQRVLSKQRGSLCRGRRVQHYSSHREPI